jgi:NADH-quinone oxidoreductase subunit H
MAIPDLTTTSAPVQAAASYWPGGYWWHWVFYTVILIGFMLGMVIIAIYIERRGMGRMQSRLGPNRAGPFGILQMFGDVIKILLKENIVPDKADKLVHWLAPIIAFVPVGMIFAVIPFQNKALLADLNIGILFIVAVSSLTTLGVFMAGWGSSNKYSLLGAMRNVAAVVSYEIPLALSIVGTLILTGTMSLNGIVLAQDIPFILVQPLGFLIFFIAGCAEINRSPFDLMEADSELVAGFHTEYSGMKFAMFYLVEYAEAIAISAIITTLFLGGWRGPLLPDWLWFIVKTLIVFFVMVWTRTTFPRVRIDQLMSLAWKFLLPLALINLFITAIQVLAWDNAINWIAVVINIVIMGVLIIVWSKFFKLGWGRLEV